MLFKSYFWEEVVFYLTVWSSGGRMERGCYMFSVWNILFTCCMYVQAYCTREQLWMVLIERMLLQWRQKDAQDVHPMLPAHTRTHTNTSNQIRGDQTSSGIWHTEKNGLLGFYTACWEAGSSSSLCLSDVKCLTMEGLLMDVCETRGTFRELSKTLNVASDSFSQLMCMCGWHLSKIDLMVLSCSVRASGRRNKCHQPSSQPFSLRAGSWRHNAR